MSYRSNLEPTWAERTDDVDTKVEILQQALRDGNHELAMGVASSIKDGIANERDLFADPGAADVSASDWVPVAQLPESWARWCEGWELFQCLNLRESTGQNRVSEPVDLLVGLPFDKVMSPGRELRVARIGSHGPQEVTSQVYGETRRGSDWFAHLVFEADVDASAESKYLIFCANPAAELPDYPSRIRVRGEGVGLEIETPDYVATLSKQMGQLESLVPKWHLGGMKLASHGNGHGEPPNIDWAHDYMSVGPFQKMRVTNWAECPHYEIVRGPLCTKVRRFGFPHGPAHPLFTPTRLFMDLSYTFYSGVPYFLKEGTMEAARDFCTLVARDDEWYFGGRPFDASLWMDEEGQVHEGKPPAEKADHVWGVGFFHRESRDSMFAVYLDHRLEGPSAEESGHTGPDGTTPSRLYQNTGLTVDHAKTGEGPHAAVWCRPMLRDNAWVQTGDRLLQRNAYLLAPYLEEGGTSGLQQLRERLLAPVEVNIVSVDDVAAGTTDVDSAQPLARIGERPADWPRKRALWDAMRDVIDDQYSEKEANLVDLGYIFDVRTRGNDVKVIMTMPHRGRPMFEFLGKPLRARLEQQADVSSVVVEFTWEPAWTPNLLSNVGREKMGL